MQRVRGKTKQSIATDDNAAAKSKKSRDNLHGDCEWIDTVIAIMVLALIDAVLYP